MVIVHKACGGPVDERGRCERCGEVLDARDARALPGPGADALALASATASD